MATTNLYQTTRLNQLESDVIYNQIIYKPKLHGLGSAQGNWEPVAYANAKKDILKISMDEIHKQSITISDNVYRRIGIRSTSEKITVQPLILEMVESGFEKRDAQEVIPLVLTELNHIFDSVTAKTLSSVAKKGTAIEWKCAPSFVNDMVAKLSILPRDMIKIVILPTKVDIALNSISHFSETRHWLEELNRRLRVLKAASLVSDSVGDKVYIIQKPLLAEYQGLFPEVHKDGFDERSHEYWMQFLMSSTDFKPRIPEAVMEYTVSSLDLSKISEATCAKKNE